MFFQRAEHLYLQGIQLIWIFGSQKKTTLNPLSMKIKILVFAGLLLATSASAQFHIGLSAGANLSFWTWKIKPINSDLEFEPAVGWRAAALGEWQMNPLLGFRAEFGTQVKANKMTKNLLFPDDILAGNFEGTPWTFREYYQYLEGSLLIQLSPIKKYRQFYLLVGSSAGRLLRGWSTSKGKESDKISSSKSSIDVKDPNYNQNAFAADFGLGGNIPLGNHSLLKIEARYQHNLSNFSASENVDASVRPILFNIGYLHRL